MAPAHPITRPEHMLPIMIVLGIMFVGICIAMNLFSRARFKKRTNAFAVPAAAAAARSATQRRTQRSSTPGGTRRLSSYCASPMPSQKASQDIAAAAAAMSSPCSQQQSMGMANNIMQSSIVDETGRTSVLRV